MPKLQRMLFTFRVTAVDRSLVTVMNLQLTDREKCNVHSLVKLQVQGEITNKHVPVVTKIPQTQLFKMIKQCKLKNLLKQVTACINHVHTAVQHSVCSQQEQSLNFLV